MADLELKDARVFYGHYSQLFVNVNILEIKTKDKTTDLKVPGVTARNANKMNFIVMNHQLV